MYDSCIPEHFKSDWEILYVAGTKNITPLGTMNHLLKNNKEFFKGMLALNGECLAHASDEQKKDKELVIIAVSNHINALIQVSDFLRGDKEFVTAAVKHHGYALSHASESLHHDFDLLRIVKSDEKRLKEFDKKWLKNK